MEPAPYEEDQSIISPIQLADDIAPPEPIKVCLSRQERRRIEQKWNKENQKTFTQRRRDAIIYMNKTQREMRKTYEQIIKQQKEQEKKQQNEHRTRHSSPSAPMDDSSSIPIVISQGGC